jgi:glutamate/tyrosine decarboxylase-like PLP-dependent enzyme
MNISDQIRELTAAGLSAHEVAARLGLRPSRVTQALARSRRLGRPGGQASIEDQIHYARRIAESTKHEHARTLALALLACLQASQ